MEALAGGETACAIDRAGAAWCWGLNTGFYEGALGDGTTNDHAYPARVDATGVLAGKRLVRIATAGPHACALDSDGAMYCWGPNGNGALGNGTKTSALSPIAVTGGSLAGKKVKSMAIRGGTTCAIDTTGQAHCWGFGSYGRLGNGKEADSTVPVAVDRGGALAGVTLESITVNASTVCALSTAGKAYCWGLGSGGALGNGTQTFAQSTPVAVDTSAASSLSGKTLTTLASSGGTVCGIDDAGSAHCWGANDNGTLGSGAALGVGSPRPVAVSKSGALAGKRLVALGTAPVNTCAIDSEGLAYCWGRGDKGTLGNGTLTAVQLTPVAVDTKGVLAGRKLVAIGGSSNTKSTNCALDSDGYVFCWGSVGYGGLGDGEPDGSPVPVRVQRPW